MNTSPVVIIVVNADWVFLQHRIAIAKALKEDNFKIIIAGTDTGKSHEILNLGFEFVNVDFSRKGLNPLSELKTLIQLYRVYQRIMPQVVYQITIKPVIYGSVVSKILKIKTINTICGLGYVFSKKENSLIRRVVSIAYRNAVNYKWAYTFFENKDDQNTFLQLNILKQKTQSIVVNGAGVDLDEYKPKLNLNNIDKIVVILATRMLWDKGVKEFVNAAKLLELNFKEKVEFRIYGMIDDGNPESIPENYLNDIEINNFLKWFGYKDDMVAVFENSNIVVLPSFYGEGLPTVLAEACAMGLPIVTTNAVGCRECVDEGVNGFKVPVKSVRGLAEAIEKLISDKDLRIKMGLASREKALRDFNQKLIVEQYKKVFDLMVNN